jgi:hypothetical protein
MSNMINLATLDVNSADGVRVTNTMKRMIKYCDSEKKLLGWFDWFRDQAVNKNKGVWDQAFQYMINRERERAQVSFGFVTNLRASLDADIADYRIKHSASRLSVPMEQSVSRLHHVTKVDECAQYVEFVKAGYETVVVLCEVMDTLWKHQEKQQMVMNDTTGNAQLLRLDQVDRVLDFERYMKARARWLIIEKIQVDMKARLDG